MESNINLCDFDTIEIETSTRTDKRKSEDMYRAMAMLDHMTRHKNEESWTSEQEYMLTVWSEKAAGYRWLHMQSHEYYKFMNNIFTYPIILLSSVLGMSGFALISYEKPTFAEIVIEYVMAACNFLVAFLSSLQKVHRCSENSEQHYSAAVEYAKFYREIKMELVLDKNNRSYSVDFCRDVKIQYDKLLTNSPDVPGHIISKFNRVFTDVQHKPDVANGLFNLNS